MADRQVGFSNILVLFNMAKIQKSEFFGFVMCPKTFGGQAEGSSEPSRIVIWNSLLMLLKR